jgi:hypothetical protein
MKRQTIVLCEPLPQPARTLGGRWKAYPPHWLVTLRCGHRQERVKLPVGRDWVICYRCREGTPDDPHIRGTDVASRRRRPRGKRTQLPAIPPAAGA